ncbi:preprotein translocase subunit SecA [Anaerovorax odorimutans]|uniref:preprotein translocase subunit SecA n=1 Tax=Anaerovorax odorimutans TaxID=109327 RepID=UPI0004231CA1|nr:hypothetical protein [Anaerovorax odorimutans]
MKKTLFQKQCVLPYADFVSKVNQFSWSTLNSSELISNIESCDKTNQPLLYSLIKEVITRCTGFTLFDTQISAAYSMAQGNIAELPTGEGKTLSAVMTATCLALQGKKVHILTFNDYLSKRDYNLNKDIFEFCRLSSSFIHEESNIMQRKQAYACNVVYASAKQVGFDYLKNFLCNDSNDILSICFDVALVDEADSILIDEARIPLVVAGNSKSESEQISKIDEIIEYMNPQDIIYDTSKHTFWFTDSGISYIENALQLDNLFKEENGDTLTFINAAVEARYLLVKDKDYLIKDGQIFVIEQTTGRIALTRKFPAALHQAVEVKEKLKDRNQTVIYNSIPLQFFLLKYQILCGMTGTAISSAKELKTMYGLAVDVIPPHISCIRKDYQDRICDTEEEKTNLILQQIKISHNKGQPVLIGTQSVKESEQYSKLLSANNLPHKVLNARNDEEEAEIIANAGKPYKITISTNMAGRGVDIRLGGKSEEEKTFVEEAGGLFVIGCGINVSSRIDRQLIGRSGRQGDPGESTFFISKEDTLLSNYFCENKLRSDKLNKKIRRAQKYEEGKSAEARYMLSKYAYILELQRQQITTYRDEILLDVRTPDFLRDYDPALFTYYCNTVGIDGIQHGEKQLTLYFINQHWADYLYTMENIRNGIHLCIIGGLNPIDEYHKAAVSAFSDMEKDIKKDVLYYMKTCKITSAGIDMEGSGLLGTSSTCTYMIDESKNQFARLPKFFLTCPTKIAIRLQYVNNSPL